MGMAAPLPVSPQDVVQLDAAVVVRGAGCGSGVLLLGEHKQVLDVSHVSDARQLLGTVWWATRAGPGNHGPH